MNAGGQLFENHDLLEFDKLKDEQIGRLAYRDNLFYLSMLIIGGIVATYFAYRKDAAFVLLGLPWAMWIIGVAHLVCERRIQDIGMYIQEHIAPHLAAHTGKPAAEIFAWEAFCRQTRWHPVRKRLQYLTTVFLYVMTGTGAVLYYWQMRDWAVLTLRPAEAVFIVLGLLLMAWMWWLIHIFSRASAPAKRRLPVVLRILAAAVVGVLAGAAVVIAAPYVSLPWPGAAAPSVTMVAIAVGVMVWSAGLYCAKR